MIHETSKNIRTNPIIQNPNLAMTVHGQSGVCDGLGVIALSVMLLSFASNGILPAISGVFLLFFGLLMVFIAIPQVGKPILSLSLEGLTTPGYGFIPWNSIQGIDKQEREHRGIKFNPILLISVPNLKKYEGQFHAFKRFFYNKKQIVLVLRNSDIKPDDILTFARQLWTERTGLDHYWSSYSTDEVNEAHRRITETIKHGKFQFDNICKAVAEKDELKAQALLKQVESNEAKLRSDWKIINDDLKKKQKILNYVALIMALFFIVYVLLLLFK